jgi:hypothetical protein
MKPAAVGGGEVATVGAVPRQGHPLDAGLAVPARVGGLPAHANTVASGIRTEGTLT